MAGTNAERAARARVALTRARKLARQLELELGSARMEFDDMTGEKMWLGQFWSGVLWIVGEAIRETARRIHSIRRETWRDRW